MTAIATAPCIKLSFTLARVSCVIS